MDGSGATRESGIGGGFREFGLDQPLVWESSVDEEVFGVGDWGSADGADFGFGDWFGGFAAIDGGVGEDAGDRGGD